MAILLNLVKSIGAWFGLPSPTLLTKSRTSISQRVSLAVGCQPAGGLGLDHCGLDLDAICRRRDNTNVDHTETETHSQNCPRPKSTIHQSAL